MELRKAHQSDKECIWDILQAAIEQRKKEGSNQWQNDYPNPDVIQSDIDMGYGYVGVAGEKILIYAAIIFDIEPAYTTIVGQWLTDQPYVVLHRIATAPAEKGRGRAIQLFQLVEDLAIRHGVYSIRVDTNFDNAAMLHIIEKLAYSYCGQVFFNNSPRRAYEKVLQLE